MKILAFNTVGSDTQFAVLNEEKEFFKEIAFSRHSETFFPNLESFLDELKLKITDFDAFACVVGPGSFTGVRIGMSVAKSFAYTLAKPLIAINSLELLAENETAHEKPICAVIDAGAGMLYHQTFVDGKPNYAPRVDTLVHLKGFLHSNYNDFLTYVYNQNNEKDDFSAEFGKSQNFTPKSLITLAKRKFSSKEYTNPITAGPIYLRVSQAEQMLGKSHQFKEATLANLSDILALEGQNDEWDLKWSEIGIRQSFDNPSYKCFLFYVEGLAKGMVSFLNLKDEAEILRVVVENSVRLQGVASSMLNSLFAWLKEHGCKKVFLEVNNQNYPAVSLYKKLGFLEIGRREGYYGKNEDAITMSKDL